MTFYRLDMFAAIRNEGVCPRGLCGSWAGTLRKSRHMILLGATQSQALRESMAISQLHRAFCNIWEWFPKTRLLFLPPASGRVAPAPGTSRQLGRRRVGRHGYERPVCKRRAAPLLFGHVLAQRHLPKATWTRLHRGDLSSGRVYHDPLILRQAGTQSTVCGAVSAPCSAFSANGLNPA